MKPALTIPIPLGHVAHWKQTEHGFEVEFLRLLTNTERLSRRPRPGQRFDPNKVREMTDAQRSKDAAEGSDKLCKAIRGMVR